MTSDIPTYRRLILPQGNNKSEYLSTVSKIHYLIENSYFARFIYKLSTFEQLHLFMYIKN